MKCPYCEKEMCLGYIPAGSMPVQWIPEGKSAPWINFTIAEEGIKLVNKFALMKANGYKAEAHYCSACKLVIAPTE